MFRQSDSSSAFPLLTHFNASAHLGRTPSVLEECADEPNQQFVSCDSHQSNRCFVSRTFLPNKKAYSTLSDRPTRQLTALHWSPFHPGPLSTETPHMDDLYSFQLCPFGRRQ
ncbi:unnamed protein product [Protopolystoma xenopodis]|uniref:Uncharacterized protein n=1 Tax=Protopolystoma xenopodis TaxID=117903 RepID=A0A448X8L8_9PLAT|nr:unnamed protein product [Protopolystoma xenopodis]